MTIGPVRASRLPVARRCAPRGASRPFLGCTAWVRRIRFYNRLSLTCTRRKNTLFGACPPSAVGKPAGVPLRDPPRRGSSPSSAADAGPPRGHPASDGSVLDGTSPASGRGASRCARALRGEDAGAFSAACRLASRALWRHFSNERGNAGAFVSPTFDLGSAGRTSMPPAFTRSRRLPPGKNRSSALAGPALSAAPVGRRARLPHVFIEVRRLRLDHWRPALASLFWPRALPRLLQIDVSTSTTLDRPNIPVQRSWRPGRLPSVDRSFPFDLGNRRRFAGSGAEDHRSSTLPPGIAPARDFAPTPIASDTSCRGHCQSPCQESAREAVEAAGAAHASKARAAGGPCDARSPRRDPAFTSPRGLPS